MLDGFFYGVELIFYPFLGGLRLFSSIMQMLF
jgi:hypothetical protein